MFTPPRSEVERDANCQTILRNRIVDGLLPEGQIFSDVQDFVPDEQLQEEATAMTGGFPCQASCSKYVFFELVAWLCIAMFLHD